VPVQGDDRDVVVGGGAADQGAHDRVAGALGQRRRLAGAGSGGIDKALLTLRDQPFGELLTTMAALDLAVFGIYGLCDARWRRV
jgi:hypothetical protein